MEKKKVLLLGDSIRLSYCERVRELLADECDVYYPPDNCAYTLFTLWNLQIAWLPAMGLEGKDFDLIHWNNGIWEHHRNLDDLEPLSTIEQYLYYNRRLHKQLASYTDKLIWATATPTNSHWTYDPKGLSRIPREDWDKEICLYNDVLAAYLRHYGVWINDLHSLIAADPERLVCEDGTHLSPEGIELVSQQVADTIRKRLHTD